MPKKHKRRGLPMPNTSAAKNGILATFSEKIGVPMKSTDDLMNWIVFGNTKDKLFTSDSSF